MDLELVSAVDTYIETLLHERDPILESALKASDDAGLPEIQISPSQGRFLYLLAKLIGARRILEIGTLGGYSTIWLARALPSGGRLVTLESETKHAEVARRNIAHAKLDDKVEVRVGSALDRLPELQSESLFDLVFIDADKNNYPGWRAAPGRQRGPRGQGDRSAFGRSERHRRPAIQRDAGQRRARRGGHPPAGRFQGLRRPRIGSRRLLNPTRPKTYQQVFHKRSLGVDRAN